MPVKPRAPGIRFLSISAPTKEPIETLFASGDVHVSTPMHNVKLSIVFDRPLGVRKVQIDSCAANDWSDGIEIFSSPGVGYVFIEGGRKSVVAKLKPTGDIESLAFGFGRNADLCLKNLKFFGDNDQPITFTLAPRSSVKLVSGDGARLFDSHPETQISLEDPVKISFAEARTFDRALISTGFTAMYAHSLRIKGDKGWTETLPLRNAVAEQEVIFRKPFTGTEMTLVAPDAGEVGELRFANKTKVESFAVDATSTSVATDLAKRFSEAGFTSVLDSKWMTGEDDKWTFLFRSDGTFFIRGFSDDTKQAKEYSAVGAYSVVRQEKGQLRITISGVRLPTSTAWDGVSCPFACASELANESSTSVVDSLVLEQNGEGTIIIRNRTPRARRTMTFGDLKIRRAVDD